jgi:hypothetical protein
MNPCPALRAFGRMILVLAALAGASVAMPGIIMSSAWAAQPLDIDEELRLLRDGRIRVHIAGARYRFAVFTFEDPDNTGLGNAVATLIGHDLLMNSQVSSLGVLRYLGNLSTPADNRQLRYFDKVEPLIESQGVQVAIWGAIRRTGSGLRIDSFTQLSPSVLSDAFSFSFRLPQQNGDGRLVHRIGPGRMLAQRLELNAAETLSLGPQAQHLDRVRAAPNDSAAVAGQLPIGKVYYIKERQGEWAHVGVEGGSDGWLRAAGFCTGPCQPLLAVSRFASGLMAYDERARIPERSAALAPDALVVIDQLQAIDALNHAPAEIADQEAMRILEAWCPTGAAADPAPPPGGAATCNLHAVAQLVGQSRQAARNRASDERLPEDLLRSVTEQLARASMSDPRHVQTLRNLGTLFEVIGDDDRARLAGQLADAADGGDPPVNAPR